MACCVVFRPCRKNKYGELYAKMWSKGIKQIVQVTILLVGCRNNSLNLIFGCFSYTVYRRVSKDCSLMQNWMADRMSCFLFVYDQQLSIGGRNYASLNLIGREAHKYLWRCSGLFEGRSSGKLVSKGRLIRG